MNNILIFLFHLNLILQCRRKNHPLCMNYVLFASLNIRLMESLERKRLIVAVAKNKEWFLQRLENVSFVRLNNLHLQLKEKRKQLTVETVKRKIW